MLAGVSSFGFGGTNVHVVVQGAPQSESESESVAQAARDTENCAADTTYLLPLSARSEPALKALARSYRDFLIAPDVNRIALRHLLRGQRAPQSS